MFVSCRHGPKYFVLCHAWGRTKWSCRDPPKNSTAQVPALVMLRTYDAPILRSPSVSRIRYVSDTDTAGIRLGYVSGDFYYFRILLCIGYAYRYVWAALDTAQHNFWPIQPTNTCNPNSLTLPLSQYPTTPRAAAASRQGGVPCSRIRQRHLRRRPTPRTPATPRDAADAPAACPAPARPLLRLCCTRTASPPPSLFPHGPTASPPPLLLTIG